MACAPAQQGSICTSVRTDASCTPACVLRAAASCAAPQVYDYTWRGDKELDELDDGSSSDEDEGVQGGLGGELVGGFPGQGGALAKG